MKKKIDSIYKYRVLFFWLLWAIVFALDLYFMAGSIRANMDSDKASEMILAKLLHDKHSWITTSWYYSTELRVIAIAPLYSVFFYFTGNWYLVRIMGAAAMYLIMSACVYYLCCQLSEKAKNLAPLIMAMVLLPFSVDWREMTLTGMYYAPQVAMSFLGFALILHICKLDKEKKAQRIILFIAHMVIAFLSGMGGLRMAIMLYVPLFMVGLVVRKENRLFLINTFIDGVMYGLGYGVNLFLRVTNKIIYVTYLRTKPALPDLRKICTLFVDLLKNTGLQTDKPVWSMMIGIICSMALWAVIIYIIIKRLIKKQTIPFEIRVAIWFLCMALAIFLMIYLFTNMDYQGRYNTHLIAYIIPVCCILLMEEKKEIMIIALGIIMILGCIPEYSRYTAREKDNRIIEYLLKNGYTKGYTSMGNGCGNAPTELSNGKIEVWVLEDDFTRRSSSSSGVDSGVIFPYDDRDITIGEWLQNTGHKNVLPEEPVFVIMSDDEYKEFVKNKERYDEHFVMEENNMKLFVFD